MWIRLISGLSIYEITIYYLAQEQVIPDSMLWRVLEDFPVLGIVLLVMYYMQKIYRTDANLQRDNIKEIYQANQVILSELIKQIETKQDRMTEEISNLSKQLTINTATVNEIAKVDSIVKELITQLEKK